MARTNNKDVHRGVVLYLDGKQVAANAKNIRAEMKKVKGEIDKMTVGSEEYVRATKKYRELDAVLQHHRAQLKSVEVQHTSLLSKGIKFFKDYSLQITGAIAALTGVAMKLNQFRKQAAEQEDAAANLKALTGLDDSNIAWLTEQAQKLSTTMEASGLRVRKSATEILEAYMLVGSKKPELLKDKEALNAVTIEAMRLAEAAKMELKDAVAGVTLAMNQYGASAEEAARYVNVLAAGSKFGAVGVATQTESIVKAGVAANMAKVPIEQLVGVLETLGERGIEGQIAGTQLKTFFLKLEAGAKETRPSVVGLQQALETLAAKNLSVTELTKMFGLESISTAQALISSADKVKYYTDAVTGTNTAVEQAAINSDTTAARMAQVRNQINLTGQDLAKTLAPIFSKMVGWTRKFVMAMPAMIDFLKKWGVELMGLAATYAAYSAVLNIGTIKLKVHNVWVATTAATTKAYRVVVDTLKASYIGLQIVQAKITGNWARQNSLMLDMKKHAAGLTNVYALMAAALTAITVAVVAYLRKMNTAGEVQKMMNKLKSDSVSKMGEEKVKIDLLVAAANNERLSLEKRKEAVDELNKIIPNYNANIDETTGKYKASKKALDEYLNSLVRQYEIEGAREKLAELGREKAEAHMKVLAQERTLENVQNAPGQNYTTSFGMVVNTREDLTQAAETHLKAAQRAEELVDAKIKSLTDAYGAQMQEAELEKSKAIDNATDIDPEPKNPSGKPEKESERQKRIRKELAAIDAKYDAMAAEAKKQYLDGELATEADYSQHLQDIELQRLDAQLKVAGLAADKREDIENRILDIKIKIMEKLKSLDNIELEGEENKLAKMLKQNEDAYNRRNVIIQKAIAAGILTEEEAAKRREANEAERRRADQKAEEDAAAKRLSISRKGLDAALLQLRQARIDEGMTDKEYNSAQLEAQRAFYETALQDQKLSKEDRESLEKQLAETKVSITENSNKEIEEKNKQMFDALQTAGSEIGEALSDWLTDTNKTFKDFSKELLKTVIKTVKNLMTAAIAQRTIDNIRTLGFWGVAKAAGEIALIEAAGGVLNGLIDNFYTGGFTGKGQWDEPRGVVHAGEFVANRYAVANDSVRPVLDLIDQAQKNGSIANLTADDIAAVARPSAAPTQTVETKTASPVTQKDPDLTQAIRLLIRTTQRAAAAYQEPSPSFCYLEGHGGINTAQDLLNTIKSNASRK